MAGMDLKDMDMGMTADTDVVICIRIRCIRIHVPGRYSVPVSNTIYDLDVLPRSQKSQLSRPGLSLYPMTRSQD